MKDARRIWTAVLLGVAMAAPLHAQEEEAGPCDKPTNKEVVKLLEAAAKA
ncbi:MAG: hypothetical protein JNL05_01370, partial [Flavobacteriales bacterium]|nr:hypothetical protein [Flavobacteriales bacterium]